MPRVPDNAPLSLKMPPGIPLSRAHRVRELFSMVAPVPEEWFKEIEKRKVDCSECDSYSILTQAWRKALKWTDGLDYALSVMLASVASTKMIGEQLWVKVIGPASCGKSTLCEGLAVNKRYILSKSTIRGFHSGWRGGPGEGQESGKPLVERVKNKTLVTKDGDTLLQSPNLSQILSEGRDLYDGVSRTDYRNSVSNDYEGVQMTWLLCGTKSLRLIDSSELGERFLDCVIMDGIDESQEDEILWRVANRASRNACVEADGKPETQRDPDLNVAMALTGGYVSYLRENAQPLLERASISSEDLRLCTSLGKFVAYMRARPSKHQEEEQGREFAARLVGQQVKLAKCLAVTMGKESVNAAVMARIRRICLDTSRGKTLEMLKRMRESEKGLAVRALGIYINYPEDKVRMLLRFLLEIGAVAIGEHEKNVGQRWVISPRLRALYDIVIPPPSSDIIRL